MQRNLQEDFDKVYRGLAAQGFEQATGFGGVCVALDRDLKKRCALGHLGNPSTGILATTREEACADWCGVHQLIGGTDKTVSSFLSSLLIAHDSGHTPSNMRCRLAEIANYYDLTIPEVQSVLDT